MVCEADPPAKVIDSDKFIGVTVECDVETASRVGVSDERADVTVGRDVVGDDEPAS